MIDSIDGQAKRPYCVGGLETDALEVLRLIVRQTERGENLDADLVGRAKTILDRYDERLARGHEALKVVPIRKEDIT